MQDGHQQFLLLRTLISSILLLKINVLLTEYIFATLEGNRINIITESDQHSTVSNLKGKLKLTTKHIFMSEYAKP